MENKPDYSSYSYKDLVDAINYVDREKYPERYEELKHRIEHFKESYNNQADSKLTADGETINQLEFTGKAEEFFSIWIVNVLLTIITVGIYSAWAKVRTQSYFYGNTFLDGSSFRYHAKPVQILKGRIIAFIMFLAYYLSGYINLKVAGVIFVIIALLLPAFIVMSNAFRLRNSSYRNVRFNFDKNFKQAYMIFLVPFIFLAVYFFLMTQLNQDIKTDAEAADITGMIPLMLMPFLIMLMFPIFEYFLVKFKVNHSSFGKSRFEFSSGVGSFGAIYFIAAVIFIGGIILTNMVMGFLVSSLSSGSSGELPVYFMPLMMIPMMSIYLWVFAFIETKKTNLIYCNTQIQGNHLQSNLQLGHMTYLYFTNTIAIAFSLGMLVPWAMIRTKRYKASCTTVISQDSLNDFVAGQSSEQSAYGEEIGEMFDMDFGF